MTTPSELADELEAQGEGYRRTLKPAWTGTNHDEALALIIVVADNLPLILSALRRVEKMEAAFSLVDHLHRQRAFSEKTFGPGQRTTGVVDHIRKELREIEADPSDVMEWVDVILLALDGAWRAGWTPEQIVAAIDAKQTKNEGRVWPDWRTADPDKAIEHDRQALTGEA